MSPKDKTRIKYYPNNNTWKKTRWKYWRDLDLCGLCGVPCKPYSMCFEHRLRHSRNMKRRYRRLKNAKKSSV